MTFRGGANVNGVDSRDLIINQLKRDIVDIKSSERNLVDVNTQLTTLEQKYRILQDEKNITDRDARTRVDKNIRNIATLKSRADTAKRELEGFNRNYDNLLADLGELEALGEKKKEELENATASEKEARELRQKIEEEISALRRKIAKERDTRTALQDDIDIANRKLDSLVEQDKEYDRKFAVIEEDLRQKAKTLEQQSRLIAEKEREIEMGTDTVVDKTSQIEETNRILSELQLEKDAKRRELDKGANQLATLKVAVKKCEADNTDLEQQIHDTSLEIRQNNNLINTRNNDLTNYTR
jgi:chromosome segregation ATPase